MSVIEYQTYLNTLNNPGPEMCQDQFDRWKDLCDKVNRDEISMNQAFKLSKKSFSNANGENQQGFGGKFNDWIIHAQEQGWIDQGMGALQGWLGERKPTLPPPPPPPPKNNINTWMIVGVLAIVGTIGVIYLNKKN
tara:strand:- start:318 stop:725 length:408 start_codon:yes stop_codon:yes gene_type:complete